MKRRLAPAAVISVVAATTALGACGAENPTAGETSTSGQGEEVTLDFSQWWEVELKEGVMRDLMDRFEAENPGIKVNLISNPYSDTMQQQVADAATGTLADVVGINGMSVYDLMSQGALAELDPLMEEAGFDPADLAKVDQVDGSTYMIRVLNFIYPMYFNLDVLEAAGVTEIPATRSDFVAAAEAVTDPDTSTYAWSLPINVQSPSGFDSQSWLWSSGGRLLDNGKPNFNTAQVKDLLTFLKDQYQGGYITPGAFTQQEADKVQEFAAGRNGMMIGSLAHINSVRATNADLNFTLGGIPVEDGYTGKPGIAAGTWGVGIADNSEHKSEAWTLVQWLLGQDVNAELATDAVAFPGNKNAVPSYVEGDPLFEKAFELYQASDLVTEIDNLPNAMDLRRNFNENLVKLLSGEASVDETAQSLQAYWEGVLG